MRKMVYQRPTKPSHLRVKRREGAPLRALPPLPDVLMLDRLTECHVTPQPVADYMVEVLDATPDHLTLEPQAGTGNLVNALLESGHSPCEVTMVERSYDLCRALSKRFSPLSMSEPIHDCFLNYAKEADNKMEYSRIILNPPFKYVKKHMAAALSLLGRGGYREAILVALVPITFEHENAELIETLPNDTFLTAAVNTKIIRIVR